MNKTILTLSISLTLVNSQCCPDEAWGQLNNNDYEIQGK